MSVKKVVMTLSKDVDVDSSRSFLQLQFPRRWEYLYRVQIRPW